MTLRLDENIHQQAAAETLLPSTIEKECPICGYVHRLCA